MAEGEIIHFELCCAARIHFELLVVGTTKKVQAADEDAEDSLEDAFEGMNM